MDLSIDKSTNIILETLDYYNRNYNSTIGSSFNMNVNNPNIQDKNERQLLMKKNMLRCGLNYLMVEK